MSTLGQVSGGRGRGARAIVAWVTFALVIAVFPAASREEPARAQAQPQSRPQSQSQTETAVAQEVRGGEYRIGPEDLLQITVWKNDAMSRIVPVRPDGFISLPLVNDVRAGGLTPMQLRAEIIKRLSDFVANPEVSVIVSDVRSFKVSVIGEVVKPGRYELKSETTALDVLAAAGGFNSFASRSRIVVLRPNGNTMQRIVFNYNKVIAPHPEQDNFYLHPGDVVLVP